MRKDIGRKDFESQEAFAKWYASGKVKNKGKFYRHLRKTGQTTKCKVIRTDARHDAHMKRHRDD